MPTKATRMRSAVTCLVSGPAVNPGADGVLVKACGFGSGRGLVLEHDRERVLPRVLNGVLHVLRQVGDGRVVVLVHVVRPKRQDVPAVLRQLARDVRAQSGRQARVLLVRHGLAAPVAYAVHEARITAIWI